MSVKVAFKYLSRKSVCTAISLIVFLYSDASKII